jgi:membrane protease YdiL (CAAX protease family)
MNIQKTQSSSLWVAPFLLAGVVLAKLTFVWVPILHAQGLEPLVAFMLLAPAFLFFPLILFSACVLWIERPCSAANLVARLWLQRPTRSDWRVAAIGAVSIAVFSAALALLAGALSLPVHPPTIPPLHPITHDRLWIVGLWFFYWPLNIVSEELAWRSVLLPRMEMALGRHAWALNAALWFCFHLAFGPGNLLVLTPTIALVPYVVQRRRNAWLGVLLHAVLSLPGFVAMASGLSNL